MAKNAVRTSAKVASKASKVLSSGNGSNVARALAGSALSNRKKTSKK
ncbi:MAG: hypothetical protein IJM49_02880 [Firmicutes bacterium]|nr:hypothetical protein [Bacillota bacterium]